MQLASPKQLYKFDRPREKLISKGAQSLTLPELIQVLIGSGVKDSPVEVIAKEVSGLMLEHGSKLAVMDMKHIKGLSSAKTASLLAAIELVNRLEAAPRQSLTSPTALVQLLQEYATKKQEHLVCVSLDGKCSMIEKRVVSVGTLTSTLIHPREVFADAITDRAASVALLHNHPSGDVNPSNEDLEVTKILVNASKILGLPVEDHIIISPRLDYFSFREHKLI